MTRSGGFLCSYYTEGKRTGKNFKTLEEASNYIAEVKVAELNLLINKYRDALSENAIQEIISIFENMASPCN